MAQHSMKRGAAAVLLVLALVRCAGEPGSSAPAEAPAATAVAGPSLVLVTIDTLRADHLPAYGYFRATAPAFEALAREGVLFENAIAPMATTLPSHTSLLTSTYPVRHGVLSNFNFYKRAAMTTSEIRSAAQMLADRGYRTAGFTSSSPLCAESGISAGFQVFAGPPLEDEEVGRVDAAAASTVDQALGWIAGAAHPFFLWVHLFDPHTPYVPPAPFDSSYGVTERLWSWIDERRMPQDLRAQATAAINLYDGEIQYADAQLARLLEALKQRGLYDDAIVVFTADHGEGLYQHSVLEHGVIWNEQLRVPLVIRFPRGVLPAGLGRRSPKLASLIDVLPTLAAQAGLPLDTAQFDGIDLLSAERSSVLAQREIREGPWEDENYALVERDWKYTHFVAFEDEDMLFDLRQDPHETRNLRADRPEVASRMKAELLRLVAEGKRRSPLPVTGEVPEEIQRRLEALGYVR